MTSVEEKIPMKTNTFDIKVAFIGYVSVGKSTVLNALLGDKFSEVALKRTTAGANFFRVHQPLQHDGSESEERSASNGWSTLADDRELQHADVVHQEISKDNEVLRLSETVGEKTFDIQINHPICEMRNDTQLVLVDIPGINEADSSQKYKDYVKSNWKTFDCAVVVMDAIQGVNTQEQVDLLSMVKHYNQELKDIPTIVLVNKMDDLEDQDTIRQIHETYSKTVEIFGAVDYCSMGRSADLPDSTKSSETSGNMTKTAFVPLSAKNAFTYMKAGCIDLNSLDDPKHSDLIQKIGHDEYGRKWHRMDRETQLAAVREIIESAAELEERLVSTNFISFISSLSDLLGGNQRQCDIISKQIDMLLNDLRQSPIQSASISESIMKVLKRSESIGRTNIKAFETTFWEIFEQYHAKVFLDLETKVCPKRFEKLFLELERYHEMTAMLQWNEESQNVILRMKRLVRDQLQFVLTKLEGWSFESYCRASGGENDGYFYMERYCDYCNHPPSYGSYDRPHCHRVQRSHSDGHIYACARQSAAMHWKEGWTSQKDVTWENLSPNDWIALLSCLSFVWDGFRLKEDFSIEELKLNAALMRFNCTFNPLSGIFFDGSTMMETPNRICLFAYREECKKKNENLNSRIKVPGSLADPSHWGCLAWKYMNFSGRNTQKYIGSNE